MNNFFKFKQNNKKIDKFWKSVFVLTSGSVVAQLITIGSSVFITRIFTAEELGIYSLILTAGSIFGSIVCGRYDIAIVTEPDEKKIYPIIKLSFLMCIFISIIGTAIYGSYYFILSDKYKNYKYAIIFIFFILFLNGIIRILESYNNRKKEYKTMTSFYIIRTSIQNIGAIILGALNFGVIGLLLSQTLGLLFGVKKQAKSLVKNITKIIYSPRVDVIATMKENYKLPLYSTPAVFASNFSYSSINLFVESLYGLGILGYYSISYKVLGIPLSVMSNNVSKVFFKEATNEYNNTGKFINTFKKISFTLIIFSVPMMIVMYYIAPYAFEIVFGEGWREAGIYVKILTPMFGIRFIVNTISYGLQVAKKQGMELILQISFLLCSVVCFIISKTFTLSIFNYLYLISFTFSIVYIIYYLYVWRCSLGKY